jgi:septal ring factor EnvC (AmiA/AmiB activator)
MWIAAALLGGSLYQASEARQTRKAATAQQIAQLQQQERDAAMMREEMARQTAAYNQQAASLQSQADLARTAFETSQLQYQENRLAMEQKAKEVQAAADEERRKAAAAEASALRARTRGGRRSLLSQERLTPELGIAGTMLGQEMRV